jgi:murein DD-endopeptidase MepM/ murein hydrolase activator NlpD
VIGVDALSDLRARALSLPVKGIDSKDLQDTFEDKRGDGRRHEAIDILASRNTPVLAVEDGTVARLFTSKAGGLTVYQFDPSSTYAYYYAHLERYASGLTDGDRVRRGQVLGYVGTSGNAPPDTPHLHFAIFKLTDKKQWWQGTADRSVCRASLVRCISHGEDETRRPRMFRGFSPNVFRDLRVALSPCSPRER